MMNEEQIKTFAAIEAERIIKHIIYLRKKQGLTQEKLAEKASISRNTIVQIERGSVKISLVTFCSLLKGLDISYSDFFKEFEDEQALVNESDTEMVDLFKQLNLHPHRSEYIKIIQSLIDIK